MLKDVIVSIAGMQYAIDDTNPIEVIGFGQYFNKNGKIFVLYDEVSEENEINQEVTKSTIKISGDQVELIKKGVNNTHMVFEKGKSHMSCYNTPFGQLMIGIHTKNIRVKEETEDMSIHIDYSLDVNYAHVSDCQIKIKVISKQIEI